MGDYKYLNLTSAVKEKDSPLRQYLSTRFPDTRALQTDYRRDAGALLVDGGEANPGTLGAAFDFMTRFAADPGYVPDLATLAFRSNPQMLAAIGEVAHAAQSATHDAEGGDLLASAAWALAACTEVYRMGVLSPGSPLAPLIARDQFTGTALLSLTSDDARRQLRELHALAAEHLHPAILEADRVSIGPTFDGSTLCSADADMIFDGVLLEMKTRLGVANQRTGVRSDSLALADLYQIMAYALFDHSDSYDITTLAMYSARYGAFVSWPLDEALDTMAGEPIHLQAERDHVWGLLGG